LHCQQVLRAHSHLNLLQIGEIGYVVMFALHITVCMWYLVGTYDHLREDDCIIRAGWVKRVQFRPYDSYTYRYTTAIYTLARGVPELAAQVRCAGGKNSREFGATH
jgi:hypothetical protein